MYTIERNISLPQPRAEALKLRPTKWRFIKEMQFGDSFLVPTSQSNKQPNPYYWQESIRAIARRYGITLTSRIVKEGVRFWCIERHPYA
jgi:hypothetical protein